ncbi:MAG: spore cortex biosynthesis protein YabQ [Bacilli bacterium]|nr:spore cortex biosynthesis protein YabQ [Bacilli bacterium]
MALEVQYLTFLSLLASGIVLGAVYDSYTVVLREWRFLRFLRPMVDLSYWICGLVVVFYLLMRINHADFRISIYLLLLIGWFLYRITLRQAVIASTVGIIMAIGWVLLIVWRVVNLLVIKPVWFTMRVVYRIVLLMDRLLKAMELVLLWPFKVIFKTAVSILRLLFQPLLRRLMVILSPYLNQAGQRWGLMQNKWKELTSFMSNWLIKKDDDDHPPS